MEYLYVCHFSNGHIKVGRSIDPQSRIAAHADRVACMGVELSEHHIVECVGHSAPAEAALIEQCASRASKRNKSEWFEGLDFLDVVEAANTLAKQEFERTRSTKLHDYLQSPNRLTAAELAERIGVKNVAQIRQWQHGYAGRLPSPENCYSIETATGGEVTRQELRPTDFWKIWPDLEHLKPTSEPV